MKRQRYEEKTCLETSASQKKLSPKKGRIEQYIFLRHVQDEIRKKENGRNKKKPEVQEESKKSRLAFETSKVVTLALVRGGKEISSTQDFVRRSYVNTLTNVFFSGPSTRDIRAFTLVSFLQEVQSGKF